MMGQTWATWVCHIINHDSDPDASAMDVTAALLLALGAEGKGDLIMPSIAVQHSSGANPPEGQRLASGV